MVDGEALIQWREDMSQDYPGKGQALFQVHILVYAVKEHNYHYFLYHLYTSISYQILKLVINHF